MSLRRFIAGPVSFGLTLGLAIVALLLQDWSLDPFPIHALVTWGLALAITALTLKLGWPILHVSAAGLLVVTTGFMDGMPEWPLPLAAAVGVMAMGRFASVGFASRWVSRAVGLLSLIGAVGLLWVKIQGDVNLGGGPSSWFETGAAILALVVVAVLGFWHGGDGEED